MDTTSSRSTDHDVSVGVLENEGFDTGYFGAHCNTCGMWIGPHRDSEQGADADAARHYEAVREQRLWPKSHLALVSLNQSAMDTMNGLLEEGDGPIDFGPYYASCDDCGGYVGLGRSTEAEASAEAGQHTTAFAALRPPGDA